MKKESLNKYAELDLWIDSMKIALIEKDSQKAFNLTQNLPFSESSLSDIDSNILERLDIAKELISQCIDLLNTDKSQVREQLDRILKAKKFFE